MTKDERNYDVHETGHIELSGMTMEELIEKGYAEEAGDEDTPNPPISE